MDSPGTSHSLQNQLQFQVKPHFSTGFLLQGAIIFFCYTLRLNFKYCFLLFGWLAILVCYLQFREPETEQPKQPWQQMKLQPTEKVKAVLLTMVIYRIHEAFHFKYIISLSEIAKEHSK